MFPQLTVPVCVCGVSLSAPDFDGFFNAYHNPECAWVFMVIPPIMEALEIDDHIKITDAYARGELITQLLSIYLHYQDSEPKINHLVNEIVQSDCLSSFDDDDLIF